MRVLLGLGVVLGLLSAPQTEVNVSASASDLWVSYTVSVSGTGGNSDSIKVSTSWPGLPAQVRTYPGNTMVNDSVVWVNGRPPANNTIAGTVTATAYRRALTSTASKAWSYTEPDVAPPAPVITTAAHPGS